ncbi:MAG: acyl-CoA-binding protein [Bacteroidota bacterium]
MNDLDRKFEKAYKIASEMKETLPPDVMLRFYAYYKQATINTPFYRPSGGNVLINAFKLNAWFQVNKLSEEEAKEKYIALVEEHNNIKIE